MTGISITAVSDLHGFHPVLEGGDLLIVAGDLTARDTEKEYDDFWRWLLYQNYRKKVVIAGNHDNFLRKHPGFLKDCGDDIVYLCDSGTEFEGLKIWGSPWTRTFEGMNPHCKAFTVDTEEELAEKWALIPQDTAILITHSPPHGILDKVKRYTKDGRKEECVGSKSLRRIVGSVKPKLWVCGHIHEGYGVYKDQTLKGVEYHIVNASHVNEVYDPVNKPVRVVL